jgi:hypothetical protein
MSTSATASVRIQTHLQSCAVSLLGNHDAIMIFLRAYYTTLVGRVLGALPLPEIEESARREWRHMMESLLQKSTISQQAIPSFEAIWSEAYAFLRFHCGHGEFGPEDHNSLWVEDVEYFGTPCQKITVLIFEELRAVPMLVPSINDIVMNQPRYIDSPANLVEQLDARTLAAPDMLLDLDHAIGAFRSDADAICTLIGLFGPMVLSAVNYLWAGGGTNIFSPERADFDVEPLIKYIRRAVGDPFSDLSIQARQQLAGVNVRGIFMLLLLDAVELNNNFPLASEIHWRMFQRFVRGVCRSAVTHNCVQHVREALEQYGLDEFLDPTALPVSGWEPLAFEDILEPEDDDFEPDIDWDDLFDDFHEPSGPDTRVERHVIAVTATSDLPEEDCSICRDTFNILSTSRDEVPVKIDCGHCFHYGCLGTLINGIQDYSNVCPNCRQKICPPRGKRQKDEHQSLYDAPLVGAKEVEARGADAVPNLCDKEGDVVMTDC